MTAQITLLSVEQFKHFHFPFELWCFCGTLAQIRIGLCNSLCRRDLFQVLVSILFLNLLHAVDLVPLQPYSRSLGEKVLVPALCYSTHDVLAMWAEASSSSAGLYRLSLPLLPIITNGLSFCLKVASPLSVHITVLISILSGTSFVITGKKKKKKRLGYI